MGQCALGSRQSEWRGFIELEQAELGCFVGRQCKELCLGAAPVTLCIDFRARSKIAGATVSGVPLYTDGSGADFLRGCVVDKTKRSAQSVAKMREFPRSSPTAPRNVEVLVFPKVQLLDVTGPAQVFASANEIVEAAGGSRPYRTRLLAQPSGEVLSDAGIALAAVPLGRGNEPTDTLIVAGGAGVEAAASNPELLDWFRQKTAVARRVASVCTGAFFLAKAGLLDGRRATTHWKFAESLGKRYPAIHVEPDPIFLCDGSVWTSAGITAGIDLALALVEADLGRSVALAVARYLVVFLKRPGGQAQFSATLALQSAEDRFGALHSWIKEHIREPLPLSVLAEQAAMSERSFSRHYTAETGQTPARAVEALRVEAARFLLSESSEPIKRIARRCGFGSEETMRRSFLRLLAVTPQDYRARFTF